MALRVSMALAPLAIAITTRWPGLSIDSRALRGSMACSKCVTPASHGSICFPTSKSLGHSSSCVNKRVVITKYLANSTEARLEIINNTNLMYFFVPQKAEIFTLKGCSSRSSATTTRRMLRLARLLVCTRIRKPGHC